MVVQKFGLVTPVEALHGAGPTQIRGFWGESLQGLPRAVCCGVVSTAVPCDASREEQPAAKTEPRRLSHAWCCYLPCVVSTEKCFACGIIFFKYIIRENDSPNCGWMLMALEWQTDCRK